MICVVGDPSKLPMPSVDWDGVAPEAIRKFFAPGSPFAKNRRWFEEHAAEIKQQHREKWVSVAGEELFVADTEKAAIEAARAAHPEETGPTITRYILPPFVSSQHAI